MYVWCFAAGCLMGFWAALGLLFWVLFRDAAVVGSSRKRHVRWHLDHLKTRNTRRPGDTAAADALGATIQEYLEKSLEQNNDSAESCTWMNIVVQRFFHSFAQLQRAGTLDLEKSINDKLAQVQRPSFLGPVTVTDINLGRLFSSLGYPFDTRSWGQTRSA